MSKTMMVMAGGTGGHIFPALAVADKMRQRGWRIVWLGNPDGMEARLVPQHGYETVAWIKFAALRGKGCCASCCCRSICCAASGRPSARCAGFSRMSCSAWVVTSLSLVA